MCEVGAGLSVFVPRVRKEALNFRFTIKKITIPDQLPMNFAIFEINYVISVRKNQQL
jgi:hypothetical protein